MNIPRKDERPRISEYQGRTGKVLHRLQELHPVLIDLSLERLETLLEKLGHPERHLPPVVHVAGTNGKGSTCANLRAITEKAGLRVHVMTSPHLLSITERFRLAGKLVSEEHLITTLEEIEQVNEGAPITVFEVLTAAGFLLFSRVPADIAIIEVGLGGRFDATNVLPTAQACIVTSISLDHQAFIGDDLASIAQEKAGIIKNGVPVITGPQESVALDILRKEAASHNAALHVIGHDITIQPHQESFSYHDDMGVLELPLPALKGPHQIINATQAIAALRFGGFSLPEKAFQAIATTKWPARLQSLQGKLKTLLPENWSLILDGGHNAGAGKALAQVLQTWNDQPLHLIVGLKDRKDACDFLRPLLPYITSLHAVEEEKQHLAMKISAIQSAAEKAGGKALAGPTVSQTLQRLTQEAGPSAPPARVLVCGSLYLAGCILAQEGYRHA